MKLADQYGILAGRTQATTLQRCSRTYDTLPSGWRFAAIPPQQQYWPDSGYGLASTRHLQLKRSEESWSLRLAQPLQLINYVAISSGGSGPLLMQCYWMTLSQLPRSISASGLRNFCYSPLRLYSTRGTAMPLPADALAD